MCAQCTAWIPAEVTTPDEVGCNTFSSFPHSPLRWVQSCLGHVWRVHLIPTDTVTSISDIDSVFTSFQQTGLPVPWTSMAVPPHSHRHSHQYFRHGQRVYLIPTDRFTSALDMYGSFTSFPQTQSPVFQTWTACLPHSNKQVYQCLGQVWRVHLIPSDSFTGVSDLKWV